jgi:hypothetical protein
MIEVSARMLSGVSAFSNFCGQEAVPRRSESKATRSGSHRHYVANVISRRCTNEFKSALGLLLCIVAPRHRANRHHEFTPATFHETDNARLIVCADNDDRTRHDASLSICLSWR